MSLATCSPNAGAPCGPQSSLQPLLLIIKRQSKRHMSLHGVAESIVLDDVLEDALEPRTRPAPVEIELLAEHAELGLEDVTVELGHLGVVGQIFVHARVAVAP